MNSQSALVDRTLAEVTLHRVREGLAHSETACVTQVLEVLQEMAQKADRLSILGERVALTPTRLQQLKALRNQLAVLRH